MIKLDKNIMDIFKRLKEIQNEPDKKDITMFETHICNDFIVSNLIDYIDLKEMSRLSLANYEIANIIWSFDIYSDEIVEMDKYVSQYINGVMPYVYVGNPYLRVSYGRLNMKTNVVRERGFPTIKDKKLEKTKSKYKWGEIIPTKLKVTLRNGKKIYENENFKQYNQPTCVGGNYCFCSIKCIDNLKFRHYIK